MSSSESSGPQGQFFLCSLLPGGLDVLGVINVNGTSVSAAVEGDNSTPLASPSSLFSVDDEDDLFGDKEFEALQAAHGIAPSASSPAPVPSPASSVDDEDDLFGDKEFEAAQAAKTSLDDVVSSAPGSPCSLFNADIDDEDLFGDKEYEAAHAASEGPAKDNNNVLSEEEFEDLLSREYDAFRAAQASETGSSDTPSASGDAEPENKNILSDQEFEDLLSREYDAFRAAQASEAGSSPVAPAASHNEPNNKSFLSDQEFEDLLSREFDAFQAAAAARSASESSTSVVDNVSSNKTSSEKTTTPVSYPYVGGLTMPLAPAAAPTVPGPSRTKTTVPSRARKANRPVPSAPAKLAGDSKDKEWVDPPDSLAARLRVQAQEKKKPRKRQQPARTAAEQSLIAPEPEDEDPRSLMAPEPATQRDKKGQKRKRQAKTLAPAAQALKDRVETQLANATVAFRLRKLKRPWEHWKEGCRHVNRTLNSKRVEGHVKKCHDERDKQCEIERNSKRDSECECELERDDNPGRWKWCAGR
ncbi:hypothetical protein NEMBOFW57_010680 [Staphylotrichum longicolle]|uniref:Uncharacterized protein n=1 Tax=Staphylotrichum longicolle TaxID=669026 RepID=A0AAD4EN61_9PEZI|nr:hypothetical protein NEMBOFW57_010680 [Staphylotrichum longicolle]